MASRRLHNRRPKRESLGKRLRQSTLRAIHLRDKKRCIYCGSTKEPLHLDHIIPKTKGGTDSPNNLVTSCAACNCARKTMSLRQWSAIKGAQLGLAPDTIARRVRRRLQSTRVDWYRK